MKKKSIIAILSAVVLMVVASLALVFTIGPKASADSEPTVGILDQESFFKISNVGALYGLSDEGQSYADNYDQLEVVIPNTATILGHGFSIFGNCSAFSRTSCKFQ